jgi:hypothetical protein
VYQGKYGRIMLNGEHPCYQVHDESEDKVEVILGEWIDILNNDIPSLLDEKDTDLLNIRDEMLAEINKLKYLLTLS